MALDKYHKYIPATGFARHLTLTILFCLGYWGLVKIGQHWRAPAGDASLIWPAAGLALFGMLTFGKQALPGIWLGTLCSGIAASSYKLFGWPFIAAHCAMATAVCVQAYVIARINALSLKNITEFNVKHLGLFVASVLTGCVISSLVGNFSLFALGNLSAEKVLESILVWWKGDTIGILLFTPFLLWICFPSLAQQNPRIPFYLMFTSGLGLLLLLVALLGAMQREAEENQFYADANLLTVTLANETNTSFHDLKLLSKYLSKGSDGNQDFAELSATLLESSPWIDYVAWIPTKPFNQSLPPKNYRLATDKISAVKLVGSSTRVIDSQSALQLIAVSANSDLMQAAMQELQPIAGPINTQAIEHKSGQPSVAIFYPIFRCNTYRKNKVCYALGVIAVQMNLQQWLLQGLNVSLKAPIAIGLAPDAMGPPLLLWRNNTWVKSDNLYSPLSNSVKLRRPWNLAQQNFSLVYEIPFAYPHLPGWLELITFAFGMTLLSLLTAYLLTRQKNQDLLLAQHSELKREVDFQHLALREANDWLLKEIETRQSIQEELEDSRAVLMQRTQELRSVLDNIPDPVWLKNMDGIYIDCNKAFSTFIGKPEAEIVGLSESDLVDSKVAQLFRRNDRVALGSNKPHRYEQWLKAADGKLHMLDTLKVVVRDDKENPYGILGIGRDISDKHELISELEKFKRFAEFSSQGFGIADLSGNILYMNPSLQIMLTGERMNLIEGENFINYYTEASRQKLTEKIIPELLAVGEWQGELELQLKDGSVFPTNETFFVIRDDRNKPLYIGDVVIDISVQKKIQQDLQMAKDAAEQAARAKSRFLANMSHEIRTPLNAVLGYTQLLMRDPVIAGNQRERLELILSASQRLLGLINDVLDLSKIEAGVLNLRTDYFDLHQEVSDVVAIMAGRAQLKGVALSSFVDFSAPAIVKGDRQKIGQVLLNLLGNAVKFTDQGQVLLTVSRTQEWVEFEIADTGVGIASDELALLFTAFRQGHAGEDTGGTGLGLALSRHLAEGMGGSLQLTSVLGEGTKALLRLPLPLESVIVAAPQHYEKMPTLAAHVKCAVLVVEDDRASSDVLVSLLRATGCQVTSADNGRAGLAACEQQVFDIIFTDIRMPDVNGLEMHNRLRNDSRFNSSYKTIPIVAVSASSLEHERTYYLAQGFQEFIGKPYQFDAVFNALRDLAGVELILSDTELTAVDQSAINDASAEKNPALADNAQLIASLNELSHVAAAGDMNSAKKIIAGVESAALGKDRYQQLLLAIKQYNLERVEQLISTWLDEATS